MRFKPFYIPERVLCSVVCCGHYGDGMCSTSANSRVMCCPAQGQPWDHQTTDGSFTKKMYPNATKMLSPLIADSISLLEFVQFHIFEVAQCLLHSSELNPCFQVRDLFLKNAQRV